MFQSNFLKDLRPISVLPCLSKVLEKAVCLQLTDYLESNGLLPHVQSGFRRNRSTATALLDVADIVKCIKNCRFHLYADDVQLYLSFKPNDVKSAVDQINQDLSRISEWSVRNSLTLNPIKSKYIVMGSKHQVNKINSKNPQITINGEVIEKTDQVRNLGLKMDSEMRFESHIMEYFSVSFHCDCFQYSYEALFRSLQYALVDNSCREYLFTTEFFHVKGSHAQELFDRILGKTLSLLVKNVENYVVECFDCLALFLCIQLINRYRWMCHKRAVAALDSYWDSLHSIIWPRLDLILRFNIQSVRECDPAKLSNKELGPHYITRRYAEFSAAMLSLSEQFPSEDLSSLLLNLQDEVNCFLLKMAAEFSQRIQQLIFLINNYDMILSILMERTRDNTKEAENFRDQLQARSAEYVEEILSPHFGGMIQFVKEGELLLESDKKLELLSMEKKTLSLVASFSASWKQSLEEIHREVLVSFPNLVTGSGLLQMALTNFVQYYNKFVKLLTPNARTQLVNIHVIMVEIKKYKTNY
ncbi:vacuolar protein sorting-associated protein 52 homolog [Choristoneura fumiferana]|uniref:vacuolar protein sorting-associated protein 52 homolog n=1 Tax=Choristoneura fumiferana TaxID=7141 RepID=UPI003D15B116